jgi:hypothetical protein
MAANIAAPIMSFLTSVQLLVPCIAHLPQASACFALRNTLIRAKFRAVPRRNLLGRAGLKSRG